MWQDYFHPNDAYGLLSSMALKDRDENWLTNDRALKLMRAMCERLGTQGRAQGINPDQPLKLVTAQLMKKYGSVQPPSLPSLLPHADLIRSAVLAGDQHVSLLAMESFNDNKGVILALLTRLSSSLTGKSRSYRPG